MIRYLRPGRWTRDQISIAWIPSTRVSVPVVESAIDSAWDAAMNRPGVHLFDGPMCRLESCEATDTRVQLTLSKTSYKTFLGTNMENPGFADRFGADVMANPLGISTLLQSSDHRLLLGERTSAMAYHPGRVHPFAGCMEPADADPFVTAHRELIEELSMPSKEIAEIVCIGLVEPQDLRQPELILLASVSSSESQIQARLDPVEHRALCSISADGNAIENAVRKDPRFTPVAVGALTLWGRLNLGQAWFDQMK